MNLKNETPPFIIVGPLIHSISLNQLEFIPHGTVVVSNGKIVLVQNHSNDLEDIQRKYQVREEEVEILESGQFLIPGFVDTHIHAPQYPNIGLGYDLPLLQWLQKYTFPLEKKFQDEDFARKVYDAVVVSLTDSRISFKTKEKAKKDSTLRMGGGGSFQSKTLACGTTTANYFATVHKSASCILAESVKKWGQRAFVGKVNMNKNVFSDYGETFEQSLADTIAFVEFVLNLGCPLIKPVITPRFALGCDMKLMKALGQIAEKYHLSIQTHISENLEEIKQVKKEFPDLKNYAQVYEEAGLMTNRTVLAHGIHLEREEIEIIKEKGATISHCPNSNILLQSGVCPVYDYLNSGLKVSLGTDCSGGNTCSMLDCIRQTLMLSIQASFNKKSKKLSIEEVFYMATLGGAEAMCLQNVTGNFRTGKDFDAILVDLNDSQVIDLLEDYNLRQLFQKFIYLGNDQLMKKVFVAGRIVKQL